MGTAARILHVMAMGALAAAGPPAGAANPAPYLYAWSGDEDEKDSDFLAVIDADPASPDYGRVVGTGPIGVKATMPHHIEYETPPGTRLFANGWKASHSFVLDLADPLKPRVSAQFETAGDYRYPHSFARLPNGNVLATFQATGDKYAPPGALVELDDNGKVVRASPSATPDIPAATNWPYSLAVVPAAGRIVSTSTDMGMGPGWKSPPTNHVQIWSLDDLKLLASVALPKAPEGDHHIYPAEPRLLADGSVYVNTFTCGLYRIEGLATARPAARFVHAFPSGPKDHDMCAVPVVYGKHWIQTAGAINGLVVLDASDPARPVEVSRLALPHAYHAPHWVAADRASGRVAVTGMQDSWLAMLKFDERTGTLSLDESFGENGGIQFDRKQWPHGDTGKAMVHGVVFSRSAAAPPASQQPSEATLRAADAEQMRIIVEEDARAQQAFMHPNYMLNGPANAVKRKGELVAMLARGEIASERFTRKVEGVAITNNVGIVMGSEIVTPAANSNLGRLHPGKTLLRRYTNVFIWEGGRWQFLARQASIVSP